MKEEILKLIESKKEISLVQIYLEFPKESRSKVRSCLNTLVNTKKITRTKRGYYSNNNNP